MDLIHAYQKNDAPNVELFDTLILCDIRNVNCTNEQRLRSYSYLLITNNKYST